LPERYLSDPPGIPLIIPIFRGEIAIRIAADGNWYHEGRGFSEHRWSGRLPASCAASGTITFLGETFEMGSTDE
jgi:hypothetical protein